MLVLFELLKISHIGINCFLHVISFFLITIASYGILHLTLGLVGNYLAVSYMWAITKF